MDLTQFSLSLARLDIADDGIEHWQKCMQDHENAKLYYETAAYEDHPTYWYDPRIVFLIGNVGIPAEARAYLFLSFLAKLVPNPDQISTWPAMKSVLIDIEENTGFVAEKDRLIPVIPAFLEKFEQQNTGTLEAWALEQVYGSIWLHIRHMIRMIQRTGPLFRDLSAAYENMMTRLVTPAITDTAEVPGPKGTLVLSSHFRFHNQHMQHTKLRFPERFFLMTGPQVNSEAVANIMPMLMLKALNKGKAVYVAIDGGNGNLNREVSVFGIKVPLPSSFIWVAWKQKCACEWSYVVANQDSAGTHLQGSALSLPDADYEDFCDAFLRQIGLQIETAMLRHPFSFGSFRHVWRDLRVT